MAKEHIYTRVKEGYFTHSEGYDTVALSQGLTKEYINKNINPFCFYDKNADNTANIYYYKYIENPLNNLQAVIFGRNSYIYSSRNYILSNSIIICDQEELKILDNNFEEFIEFDSYTKTPKTPKVLDDVLIASYFKPYDVLMERDLIFNLLSLDEFKYKYLLQSILQCIQKKETIYIKLKCDKKLYSRYAKKLIKVLFINIPKNLKMNLSYITYSSTSNLKVFFHIVFLDRDANISSDTLSFDFFNSYKSDKYGEFLDFAWKNILLANKMILNSELYNYKYNIYNLLFYLDKASIKILEFCEAKIIDKSSYKNLTNIEYINRVNLFLDLLAFTSLNRENLIKSITYLSSIFKNKLEYKNTGILLNTLNFLALKNFGINKDAFLNIVYSYYKLSFDQNIQFINNTICSANDFEDFIVLSFFYINYMNDLISKEKIEQIYNTIYNKFLDFEEKTDLRKENINGLSVYLWKRYRDWI